MTYTAAAARYERQPYRRVGRSGLHLPSVSLGLWQNFGDTRPTSRLNADNPALGPSTLGVTHFDLANNTVPPTAPPKRTSGGFREISHNHRDELVISTKAGYDMWPGPYGDHGSRKYLLASLDQRLARIGLDYVDIFYSHRADPEHPTGRDDGCAATRPSTSGPGVCTAGISSYSPEANPAGGPAISWLDMGHAAADPPAVLTRGFPNRWIEVRSAGHPAGERRASAASPSRRWPRAC